jgi:uncharacterized membrane-anchored protein YhcB (DUF1043 family)
MFNLDGLIGLVVGLFIGALVTYLVKRNNPNLESDLKVKYLLLNAELKEKYGAIEKNLNDEIARLKAKLGV